MFKIVPSILSADFARLSEEIKAAEEGGAEVLHIDVMDGQFVSNITIGLPVVRSIRKVTEMKLDCHLMIEKPDRYAIKFVEAGADMVSVHIEADIHLHKTLNAVRAAGAKSGVAINPGTPLVALEEVLPYSDFVLLMSVNPGFGGQKFIPTSIQKLIRLRRMIKESGFDVRIEIDGGIDSENISKVVEAGADFIVAGSAIFDGGKPNESTQKMIDAATVWV